MRWVRRLQAGWVNWRCRKWLREVARLLEKETGMPKGSVQLRVGEEAFVKEKR